MLSFVNSVISPAWFRDLPSAKKMSIIRRNIRCARSRSTPVVIIVDSVPSRRTTGISTWALNLHALLVDEAFNCVPFLFKNSPRFVRNNSAARYRIKSLAERLSLLGRRVVVVSPEVRGLALELPANVKSCVVTHGTFAFANYSQETGDRAENLNTLSNQSFESLRRNYSQTCWPELQSVQRADFLVHPNLSYAKKQLRLYEWLFGVRVETGFHLPNFLPDNSVGQAKIKARDIDFCFVGTPSSLKGFAAARNLAKATPGLKWAFCLPRKTSRSIVGDLRNVVSFYGLDSEGVRKVLKRSLAVVDFSLTHNQSTVLQEALFSGAGALLRDLEVYDEDLTSYPDHRRIMRLTDDQITNIAERSNQVIQFVRFLKTSAPPANFASSQSEALTVRYRTFMAQLLGVARS